jgi:magnesium transporter
MMRRSSAAREAVEALIVGGAGAGRRPVRSTSAIAAEAPIELRPRLGRLMGREFDFTALTEVDDTVREEILDELPSETVAGRARARSDDAAATRGLPRRAAEISSSCPRSNASLARSLAHPASPAGRRMD